MGIKINSVCVVSLQDLVEGLSERAILTIEDVLDEHWDRHTSTTDKQQPSFILVDRNELYDCTVDIDDMPVNDATYQGVVTFRDRVLGLNENVLIDIAGHN